MGFVRTDAPALPSTSEPVAARIPPSLHLVLILIGFTAIVAQIVLMRELVVVFYGNEISFGLILASWLLWTAVGSGLLGRLVRRVRNTRRLIAGVQVFIAAIVPATILCLRASKQAFHLTPGEIPGPWPMFLTSFVALSLFCTASGLLFAAGSRACAGNAETSTADATSFVYLMEAVGCGAGGLLASLLLLRDLDALQIALLISFVNLFAAANLLWQGSRRGRIATAALLALAAAVVIPLLSRRVDRASHSWLWHGFDVLTTRNSIYGELSVVQAESARSLYEDGLVISTVPDPAAAEEAVHFALLEHPAPTSLLLIGGGVNGSVAEALQYRTLQRVDYVELDPAIFAVARSYFPSEWTEINSNPRLHIHLADGRLFLRTTTRKFDVIIVNLPDPQTAQLNRFYTLEFFRTVAAKLTPAGVFSFQLRSAEDYISPELANFLGCIRKTLGQVFPEITVIPGSPVHFFAALRPGVLATGSEALLARLRSRPLHTRYVREYYIPFRMTPDRMLDLDMQIRPRPETAINRDFAPVAYYFAMALWSKRFHPGGSRFFQAVAAVRFGSFAAGAGLLSVALGMALGLRRTAARRRQSTAAFSVAVTGFTLMGLELLLLLGFQALYGYVYHQLAIVIAAFMAGMAVGSRWALRRSGGSDASSGVISTFTGHSELTCHSERSEESLLASGAAREAVEEGFFASLRMTGQPACHVPPDRRRDRFALGGLQVLIGLAPLLLCAVFEWCGRLEGARQLFVVSQIIFPALALLCGLLGGYQFPIASRVFFGGSARTTRGPGALYALDLLGASLGAILLSTYLIPVFGFVKTASLSAVVNLAPAGLALAASGDPRIDRESPSPEPPRTPTP